MIMGKPTHWTCGVNPAEYVRLIRALGEVQPPQPGLAKVSTTGKLARANAVRCEIGKKDRISGSHAAQM
jgi:hypothetical protein